MFGVHVSGSRKIWSIKRSSHGHQKIATLPPLGSRRSRYGRLKAMEVVIYPFVSALMFFYNLTGNLGVAVVVVTILVRMVMLPIVIPSLRSAKKMRELSPKLKELQAKYKDDKTKLAQAQMDFYRENGLNPTSGCLPQIFQIAILIIFYNAFNHIIMFTGGKLSLIDLNRSMLPIFQIQEGFKFNMGFLGTDLSAVPSKIFATGNMQALIVPVVLLVLSGLLQFVSAKVLMPEAKTGEEVVKKETPKDKEDDMMAAMRTQSLYVMPAMTLFIGWNFAVGMILYWLVSSLAILLQQVLAEKVFKI